MFLFFSFLLYISVLVCIYYLADAKEYDKQKLAESDEIQEYQATIVLLS